jgi:GlcNAc-P-P-Und epimerase
MNPAARERIIVTGGSGFVGTHLVACFRERGWEVLSLDVAPPRNPGHRDCWRSSNLLDREGLIAETQQFSPSVFLHFGARTDLNEKETFAGYAANTEGVCNVIEAIRATSSITRVIFASSQLVCSLGYQPQDMYDYRPTTLYGYSKVLSERIIRASNDIGATWTIVRPTSLWGPWFGVPYREFFQMIARNRYVHGCGERTLKQWGYVGNAAFQIWQLVHAPVESVHQQVFYLADYEPTDLRAFADTVQQAFGARRIPMMPAGILQAAAKLGDVCQVLGWRHPPLTSFRYNNMMTSELQDLEPLHRIAGPLPYSVEDGIHATVSWLREQP